MERVERKEEKPKFPIRIVDCGALAPGGVLVLGEATRPVPGQPIGFEFVFQMRSRYPSKAIPIVVITAKDLTDEDRQRLNGDVVGLIEQDGLARESLLEQLRTQLAAASTREAASETGHDA